MDSTAVTYLMQQMFSRPYTLECIMQAVVSGTYVNVHFYFPLYAFVTERKKIMYKLQPRIHYGICCTYLECPYSFLSGYYKSGLAIYIHRLR